MKRVYKTVGVEPAPGGFVVRLDGRALLSPARAPLIFAAPGLAQAVAAEWDAQDKVVRPHTMPLTQLASTAVDVVSAGRPAIIDGVAAYAGTDLVCYRASHPQSLVERQARIWQPLLDWAMLRYDAALLVHVGLMPRPQPADALRALRAAVEAMDDWRLSALQSATSSCGSLIVALALMDGHIGPDEAFEASQVDENYQIEQWGEDPETTKRRVGLTLDIGAAHRFVALMDGRAGA
jgi:chaperone required for assembly of F1-ATPase